MYPMTVLVLFWYPILDASIMLSWSIVSPNPYKLEHGSTELSSIRMTDLRVRVKQSGQVPRAVSELRERDPSTNCPKLSVCGLAVL
ncbi:hypothetical protein U1Q18_019695 [Sarracenia purpurea var. burkii]